eukprot:1156063-Pelagomonas_calceolata.AAC.3
MLATRWEHTRRSAKAAISGFCTKASRRQSRITKAAYVGDTLGAHKTFCKGSNQWFLHKGITKAERDHKGSICWRHVGSTQARRSAKAAISGFCTKVSRRQSRITKAAYVGNTLGAHKQDVLQRQQSTPQRRHAGRNRTT